MENCKLSTKPISLRLEEYTTKRKTEVLIVDLITPTKEADTVMIYNGFSSSLVQPTAYNPDIPVIAADAQITAIARVRSPYNPSNPEYIAKGITLEAMEKILAQLNL